jgi:competence protein ComEC
MSRERPLLIPLLALISGLTISDVYGILLPLSSVAAALCCLLLSCLIREHLPVTVCTFGFFLVWGLHALTPWKSPAASSCSLQRFAAHDQVIVEGIVSSRAVTTPGGSNFVLRTEGVIKDGSVTPASGNLMVSVSAGDITLFRGDRVRFSTRIVLPRRFGLPGEFDYPRYLAFQGINATGRVAAADDIVLMRGAAEDSALRLFDLEARRLGDFIRASVPDNDISSVLTALLLGDQKRIPEQLNAAYTRAGVNHILSISGFHVGIIAFFMVQAALLIATRFETLALGCNLRRLVLLIALPAMVLYLFLTGAAPATARSVIMLAAFVLALYVERETDPINALLLSALLLLALNPPSLFDISFQLSFLALWGIVIMVPAGMEHVNAIQRGWLRTLLQFIASSCAASFATAVPVLFYFNQASMNGIIANFLIVPLLGYGAVLAGFCALPFVHILAQPAHLMLWLAGKLTALSNYLVTLFAELPLLRFHGITRLDMLVFLGFMFALTFVRGRRLKAALCALLPSVAIFAHVVAPSAADGRLHVTMLSVGQAESLLIRLPDGGTMLVDGGGYLHDTGRDFGERFLGPALFKLGVERIDYMVMTHAHPDHVGGLPFVAQSFPVGEFWEPVPGGNGTLYDRLRSRLDAKGVGTRSLAAGDVIEPAKGVMVTVLSPPRATPRRTDQGNDDMGMNEDSLAFRVSFGATSMLFTADTGFPAEERMLRRGENMTATVLKVGHHGSRYSTSEAFIDRVAPRIALISAGHGNSFELPSARTVNLLERRGIRTYRTDRDGTVELASDGNRWSISTLDRP